MSQGRAIHKINERWGTDYRNWNGSETIGISVCKKKYAPFNFRTETLENGQVKVRVTRMYGCILHSQLRERVIRKVGPRKGWEPFGQWSMKKAEMICKKVSDRMNQEQDDNNSSNNSSSDSSSDDDIRIVSPRVTSPTNNTFSWNQLCQNGKCTWKMRDKYDDIYAEIQEADEASKR